MGQRILIVTQSAYRGGVVAVLCTLVRHWPQPGEDRLHIMYNKGHGGAQDFRALAGSCRNVVTDEIPLPDLDVLRRTFARRGGREDWMLRFAYRALAPFLFLWAIVVVGTYCRRHAITVLCSQNGGYPGGLLNRAAVLGARLAGVRRVLLVIHSLAAPRRYGFLSRIGDRVVGACCSKVVAVSVSVSEVLGLRRCLRKEAHVVHNGIVLGESETCQKKWKQQPRRWTTGLTRVGFVGQVSKEKGIEVLIDAISRLAGRVILVVFGAGEEGYVQHLRRRCHELGLDGRVYFEGYDPCAASAMYIMDVIALPSIAHEAFGMVVLEAMRASKPVIVSDVGGMKEIVSDGVTGRVVPAGDATAVAAAISEIAQDTTKATEMGRAGKVRLMEKFTAERMATEYHRLCG